MKLYVNFVTHIVFWLLKNGITIWLYRFTKVLFQKNIDLQEKTFQGGLNLFQTKSYLFNKSSISDETYVFPPSSFVAKTNSKVSSPIWQETSPIATSRV